MTTNAYSGFKFGRFWDKIPDFNGRKQKVWYPPNGKPPMHLVCIVFLAGHETKWAKNADIWPKISVLGKIWLFMGQNFI